METKKKHPGGRPPKNKTPDEMEAKIVKYFETIEEKKEVPTITGLTIACGFLSRTSLFEYMEKGGEFANAIKKAKLKIEERNEKALYDKNCPTVGVLFNLKNNYGRKDKSEQDVKHSGEIEQKIVILPAREM